MENSELKKTIERVEKSIETIGFKDSKKKNELIELLNTLKIEIEKLSETNTEHAKSIAVLTELAAHESTRKHKAHYLQKNSLEGLSGSVQGFEASHPKLTTTVNQVCLLLSSIGI